MDLQKNSSAGVVSVKKKSGMYIISTVWKCSIQNCRKSKVFHKIQYTCLNVMPCQQPKHQISAQDITVLFHIGFPSLKYAPCMLLLNSISLCKYVILSYKNWYNICAQILVTINDSIIFCSIWNTISFWQ